jgi:hypothetical protein
LRAVSHARNLAAGPSRQVREMAITVENAIFLRDFFATNIKGEHKMTLRLVDEIPGELLDRRLTDDLPTVATQLHHSFASGPWFLSVVRRGNAEWAENVLVPFEGNKSQLIEKCRSRADETERLLGGFGSEELVAEVEFNDERFPAVYMADWHVVHLVHCRAMAVSALLMQGFKARSFYGPDIFA